MNAYKKITTISFPSYLKKEILEHCLRKLEGNYHVGETAEKQAYGLVGGKIEGDNLKIEKIYCCKLNFRNATGVQPYINQLVENYAIPADTPVDQRGWVAKPEEILEAYEHFEQHDLELVGAYHMHHEESWKGEILKDYPSLFDEKLAENSGMLMFIVAIKSDGKHSIKCFFEGRKDHEIRIIEHVI